MLKDTAQKQLRRFFSKITAFKNLKKMVYKGT